MKLLSKSVLSFAVLGSAMTLTACQNMPMNQNSMPNNAQHQQMNNDPNNVHHQQMNQNVMNLSEGEIVKILSVANNGEILQAQVAMPKLQSPQVRSFAQNMIDKHTANEAKGQALAQRLSIMPRVSHASNALQVDSNNIVTRLSEATTSVDRQYIMDQIKVHGKVLATIDNELLPNARSAELRNFLTETRSAVAMHLQGAEQLRAIL